jgi:hypothetical protein
MMTLESTFSVFDRVALRSLSSMLFLIALGIYRRRQEIRETARLKNAAGSGATPRQMLERH